MKNTTSITLLIGLLLALCTNGYAAGSKDSAYDKISTIIANKLAVRQQENKQLRQQGQPGNYIVYITGEDLVQNNTYPDKVLSLPQKNTRQTDVEKLWDFQSNTYLQGLPAKLQQFSGEQGYDYYLVVCAIYDYFRLDENTDFSNITWTNSDLLSSIGASADKNKGKTVNTGGYSNLLSYLIKKFKADGSQPQTNDKPHVYHFVITTYFPYENGTDGKPVGRLRHFQGLSWSSPNNDPAFDEVWKTFYSSKQSELAGKNNTEEKKASKEEWLAGFVKANQTLLAGIRNTNPQELATITDKAKLVSKLEGIPEPVYAGFSAALRIRMLQLLSGDAMANNAEKIACALVEQAPVIQADSVITAMRLSNPFIPEIVPSKGDPLNSAGGTEPNYRVGWCLLKCLTETTQDNTMGMGGGDNYHRLIKALSSLCYKTDNFKKQAKALNDAYLNAEEEKIPDRVIFYTYNSFWSKIAGTFKFSQYIFEPKIDFSTSYDYSCGLTTEKQLFLSYAIPSGTMKKISLDPFEPIVFENKTDLGLLSDLDEIPSTGAEPPPKDHIVPAIILKYADDKASKETATDATMAAIDVLSLATGYGELKAGIKGVRKAWVIYDMINSGINIVGNVAAYDKPTLKTILQFYNLASGAVTLGRIGSGVAKGIGNIYKAVKAEKAVMNAASIRSFLTSIKNAGEDLKGLHPDDAERITAYLQRLKAEAKGRNLTNFESKVDEALTAVNAGGKVISETIKANKIFKRLAALPGVVIDQTSIVVSKTKALIAHWKEGGSVMYLDAAETAGKDGKLVDIIEGETYVPRGSTTPVQEDLMIIQGADNTVYCVRGACFVAGTPVHTQGGIKPIEQVQQLETVLSLDVQSGRQVWNKVVKTFRRTTSRLVRLVAGKDTLLSTPEHPYLTDSGWKMAAAIQPGAKLRLAGGLFAVALSTVTLDTAAVVYNFEVAATHNYCIGEQAIVVHNDCRILNKLRAQVKPALVDDFVKDFAEDAGMLSKFDKGECSLDAWEAMHAHPELRKAPDVLGAVTETLKNQSLQKLNVNKTLIDKIAKALKNDRSLATSVDKVLALEKELFGTLKKLGNFLDANPQTQLVNIERLIDDLAGSSFANRRDINFVLKDVAGDATTFAGKKIIFTVRTTPGQADYWVYSRVESRVAAGTLADYKDVIYNAGARTVSSPGNYTTTIEWSIHKNLPVRPYGNIGYWGRRIQQSKPRVDAFELRINPHNESFYARMSNGKYAQLENLSENVLQDGKMILTPDKSYYRVYNKPEFLRQKVITEATRQLDAAGVHGLSVEWLVSDEVAVEHLTRFFRENNLNITVKYYPE